MIYIICCTKRTGSTLLCQLLSGKAGQPGEYLNPLYRRHFGIAEPDRKKVDRRGYISELIDASGGIFGLKVVHSHVCGELKSQSLEKLFPEQPWYIYLTRDDKVKQAVSILIATQSGAWFGEERDDRKLQYNRASIGFHLCQVEREEEAWEWYFESMGIDPLRLRYEELAADPDGEARRVLNFLGIEVSKEPIQATMKKQADQINDAWEKRYRWGE